MCYTERYISADKPTAWWRDLTARTLPLKLRNDPLRPYIWYAVWISTAPVTLAVRQSYSSRLSLIDEHFELTSDADELPVDEFLVQRIEQDKPEDMDGIGGVTDMPSAAEAAESKSLESILMDDKDCSTFIQCRESRNIPFRNDDFPLEETGCYVSDSGEVCTVCGTGMMCD